MSSPTTKIFKIKYSGVVPEINCNIDPSGRTDLLKIIDQAEVAGHINTLRSKADFKRDAELEVDAKALTIKSLKDEETLLVVPTHMIVSVGLVVEDQMNIVPIKIGTIDDNVDIFDLAVIYTETESTAEEICQQLERCFQYVFHEAMSSPEFAVDHRGDFGAIKSVVSSSSLSPLADHDHEASAHFPAVTEVRAHKNCPSTFSLSTSATSASSKNSLDLINEYLTMLAACLTQNELNKFAVLLKRWRSKEMPVLEFAQKLMELYGPERKHLLARMKNLLRDVTRDDLVALSSFLQANGITENAASISPLLTGELSFTTGTSSGADDISACSGTFFVPTNAQGATSATQPGNLPPEQQLHSA